MWWHSDTHASIENIIYRMCSSIQTVFSAMLMWKKMHALAGKRWRFQSADSVLFKMCSLQYQYLQVFYCRQIVFCLEGVLYNTNACNSCTVGRKCSLKNVFSMILIPATLLLSAGEACLHSSHTAPHSPATTHAHRKTGLRVEGLRLRFRV